MDAWWVRDLREDWWRLDKIGTHLENQISIKNERQEFYRFSGILMSSWPRLLNSTCAYCGDISGHPWSAILGIPSSVRFFVCFFIFIFSSHYYSLLSNWYALKYVDILQFFLYQTTAWQDNVTKMDPNLIPKKQREEVRKRCKALKPNRVPIKWVKHTYIYMYIYNHIQSYTIIYNHIQTYTIIYNHIQSYTIIYNHIQSYTYIHTYVYTYMYICV